MYYTATINAYDALDQVVVAVVLRQKEEAGSRSSSTVQTLMVQLEGTGESDQTQWLRDVLVGLLETL